MGRIQAGIGGKWLSALVDSRSKDPRQKEVIDITGLMALVILAAALFILAGTLAGVFVFIETLPIYYLLVLIIPTWLAGRGRLWKWASVVPALLCFSLGAYSSFLNGFSSLGLLFYAMSVILAGILISNRLGFWMVLVCTLSYAGFGFYRSGFFPDSLAYITTFVFGLSGLALLRWYNQNHLQRVLEAQIRGNELLQEEINRREQAEVAQQKQEVQYRRLADNTSDLVAEMDPSGAIRYASPSYRAVLGYDPQAVVGMNGIEMLHPEDRQAARETIQSVSASHQPGRIQLRAVRADGTYIWVEVSGTPLYGENGELSGFVLTSRDITHQKEVEIANRAAEEKFHSLFESLRISEEKFSTAFVTSPDSVNINRLADGVYLDINQGFTRLMGYTREEVLGKSSLELNIWVDPQDRARLVKGLLENGVVENLEARFRRKNGDIAIGLMSARVIMIQGEKCILSIAREITEWIQAQVELRDTHTKLEQAYEATLRGWAHALELRERETADHSRRVVDLTLRMARTIGIPEGDFIHIERGALLHDIGKMGVPDEILLKPSHLTSDEWVIMRQHPEFARDLLEGIEYLHPSMDIPYCHHEKWDGSGYPQGLVGEDIPLAARIFSIVDVYDALTHERPYRPAWSEKEARRYLAEERGKHFDPQLVDIFLCL